jgi:BON domain
MSGEHWAFGTEPPELSEIRQALDDAEGVDARRVVLAADDGRAVLGGSVASAEEADRAVAIVERFGVPVVNRLQIDTALREGTERPPPAERVEPADQDEVLIGDPDMLAGPEAAITTDVARALDENEPLEPPEEPLFPPTPAEARRASRPGPEGPTVDADDAVDDQRPAAADLTAQDLREAAAGHPLPSLDPELDATQDDSGAEPTGVDELGAAPSEAAAEDRFPPLVPGTEPGPGAVGEPTTGGGPLGGVPATETGAIGADTASADPARGGSGGVQETGEPGPEAEEDPAIRDEPPSDR